MPKIVDDISSTNNKTNKKYLREFGLQGVNVLNKLEVLGRTNSRTFLI
jgi:hypothetical protein